MKLPRRRFLHLAAGAAALPVTSRMAMAQAYPSRPITIVVPFPAGGSTDPVARVLAEHMKGVLGQPVIVENVAGAGGTIGVGRVARAAPDGYTISIGHLGTHVVTGATYTLQYDLLKDFEPVSLLASTPVWIITKKTLPATDLKELIAWLKANPDKASAGTIGAAGGPQIAGVYFQKNTDTRFQFVPYRGGNQAMQDLVAGQIDLMFDQAANSLAQVRSGQVKAYALLAKTRWSSASDIPTIDEAGVPGLYISYWYGLWVPKGTPKDIIAKINSAVVAALADPAVRQRFTDIGQEIFPRDQQTPEALRSYQKAEIDKWWPIIKAANIKGD